MKPEHKRLREEKIAKYGCYDCIHARNGVCRTICDHDECLFADVLDKYESYEEYLEKTKFDFTIFDLLVRREKYKIDDGYRGNLHKLSDYRRD